MAKKLSSKQKKEELNKLFAQYNVRLGMLYSSYVKKLASLGYGEDVLEGDALFNFDNFPELKARLDDIFTDYFKDSVLCFKQGMTDGVALAFSHDTNAISGFSVLSDKAISTLRNATATAFISSRLKTEKGLNLSQRIWNYCQQTKSEFEMAMSNVIADGIKGGTSAENIARNIKQYLNDPDRMYRRYHTVKVLKNGKKKDVVTWRRRRVIDGKVRFIEEPLENVGAGVYRSSRMNALRVARTEINAAYLRGHNARWAKEPFVIGQWIHRSPQHKIEDICDELEGRYPKDFVFSSWHPSCMCTADPIMIEGEEKKQFYQRLFNGEDMSNYVSPNAIDDVPDEYKQYITDNEGKIIAAFQHDKLAWHLADNKKYWQKLCSKENQKLMGLETMSAKERIMQVAKKRHEQRTQEQIDQIQNRYNKHRRDYYNSLVDSVTGGKPVDSLKSKDLYERYYAIREAIKDKKSADEISKLFERFTHGWQTKLAWTDRKIAMNVMKVAQNYGETDITGIASALKSGNYTLAKQEAKSLAKTIKSIQNDEKALSALIPDVNKWHKQFTSEQLHGVYDAVENKLNQWSSLTLEQQAKKLKFEWDDFLGGNMHDVQFKYKTWKVSQAAYKQKYEQVLDAIDWKQINDVLQEAKTFKTKSAPYHSLINQLETAISAQDKANAQSIVADMQMKRIELKKAADARNAKRYAKSADGLYNGGNPFTYDELAKAKDYETKIIDSIMSGSKTDNKLIEEYHDYILKISEKYYDKQVSQFTNEEREIMRKSTEKYLARPSKNPHYIWGTNLGGVYSGKDYKVANYLPKLNGITKEELSIVQRFTNGSTFSNCYNLRKDSPYWRNKFKDKLNGFTYSEIKEQYKIIEEWSQGANYTLDRMVRYNGITFRGLDGGGGPELRKEIMNAFKNGKPWVNNASCSTSMKHSVAASFDDDTILIIHNKTGAYIHAISDYSNEYEIMTLRGTKYKILAPPKRVGSRYYVELEEMI